MIQINSLHYTTPLIGGVIISLFYHAGLWWTVRSLPRSRRPVLLSIGSFYLRVSVTMAAFYVVMQNDWRRLAVCLVGFMTVKFIITRIIGNTAAPVPDKGEKH